MSIIIVIRAAVILIVLVFLLALFPKIIWNKGEKAQIPNFNLFDDCR